MCRLCLAEKLELFDIFSCDISEDLTLFKDNLNQNFSFADIVQELAPVKIERDDCLSKNICSSCQVSCTQFLKFREMILDSQDYQASALDQETVELQTIVIEQVVADDALMEEQHQEKPEFDENFEGEGEDENVDFVYYQEVEDDTLNNDMVTTASSGDNTDDEFDCDVCNKTFKDQDKFEEHQKMHASKVRLYPCNTCKRKFTTEILRTRHEIIHTDMLTEIKNESDRCLVCNTTLTSKAALEEHMREHRLRLEKEPISCIHCDKAYNKLKNLIRHLKTHDENKTHMCNVCNKMFAMGQDFIDHLNRHKGFSPHSCYICQKSYLEVSKLRIHMRTHSNDSVSVDR